MGASKKLFMTEREYETRKQEILDQTKKWDSPQCGTPILYQLQQLKRQYEQQK